MVVHIIVVGMNHKTAPVELREQVSVSDTEIDGVLAALRRTSIFSENVVLSTCNRTEIYGVAADALAAERALRQWFAERAGCPVAEIGRHLYAYAGNAAVRHLLRVAAGLDSLVVGETQILGQVRSAYLVASDTGHTGWLFNQVFRMAIHLGKRAQTETGIGQNAVSVSYAAVQLAKKIFGELSGRRVLVIGAGKMGQLTTQHLTANGIQDIVVVNRTYENAVRLAAQFHGEALPWEQLEDALGQADIVISNTGAKGTVIQAQMLEAVMRRRNHRPLVLIDIAVPRDIDPDAGGMRHIFLYDIDDLEGVVAANLAERARQAQQVERMIDGAMREFAQWLAEQAAVPVIAALREKGIQIQQSVMDSLRRKLPHLSDREWDLLDKHTMSIVNQLLHEPVHQLKQMAADGEGARSIALCAQLFGIPDAELARRSPGTAVTGADGADAVAQWVQWIHQWRESLLAELEDRTCPSPFPTAVR